MINRLLSMFVTLAWGLWLGGMVTLFAVLGTIFTTKPFERDVQGAFAARLFPTFERMQLVFAAVALVGTACWWLARRARIKMVLFGLFALATVAAAVEASMVTPKIEQMRVQGLRETPEFKRMHTLSSRVYMGGAVVLLVAGMVLPWAIRGDAEGPLTPMSPRETSEGTAPA